MIAAMSTAPAAASLAFFASGFFSSVTRSTTASIAVLTVSRPITSPNSAMQVSHSYGRIRKMNPAIVTQTAIKIWIFMFLSLRMVANNPANAYPKLSVIGVFFIVQISLRQTPVKQIFAVCFAAGA